MAYSLMATPVHANGVDPTVVVGSATFSTTGNSLDISNTPGTVIHWQGFSIGASETTNFIQSSSSSSVLNRVLGSDPSTILGTLTSNGRVFLINPAGIMVGQGARIDVAGLVASTLNLSDADFRAGKADFTANSLAGSVENRGNITTPSGGTVYLVGSTVFNSGVIKSPEGDVILAAGQRVDIFDTSTPGVRVEIAATDSSAVNLGEILAQSGQVGIYSAALRNGGIIDARQVVRDETGSIVLRAQGQLTLDESSQLTVHGEQAGEIKVQSLTGITNVSGTIDATATAAGESGGTIHILGDRVRLVAADIDASGDGGGGTVLVGGEFHGIGPVQTSRQTALGADVSIHADAITTGNGGRVAIWSDADTSVAGIITAKGGMESGNGGLIETSGQRVKLDESTSVNTLAPQGETGLWILDPIDWTIAVAGDETPAQVQTSLASANRLIQATNNITVSDAVVWTTSQTLTLEAGNDVLINAAMTASTIDAGIVFVAGNDIITTAAITASADGAVVDMTAERDISVDVITANGGGSISLRASNHVIVNGEITADTGPNAVILRADNDGTGPGAAAGTVSFVGLGAIVTPSTEIRFNPDGYANTADEIAAYGTHVSAILDAKAWVFAEGDNKTYDGTDAATISFRGTPGDGGEVSLIDPGSGATFVDQNAGTGVAVAYAGFTLGGADSGLFSLFGAGSGTTQADITPLSLTAVELMGTVSKIYDGDATVDNLTTANYSISGFLAGEGATITNTAGGYDNGQDVIDNAAGSGVTSAALVAGDYTADAGTLLSNYDLSAVTVSATGNIGEITPLAITGSITAASKAYSGTDTASILTRSLNGQVSADDVSYSGGIATFDNKDVGNAKTVTGTGFVLIGVDATNYTVNASALTTANVTRAPLEVTAASISKSYGTTLNLGGTEFMTTGLKNGETIGAVSLDSTGFVATASVVGNPYAIIPGAAVGGTFDPNNYTIVYTNGALNVLKVPLTVSSTSATRVYGVNNPVFDATYTGFQNGESPANLSGALTFESNATLASDVGNYVITPVGQSAANYMIDYVDGTLTVTPAPLLVTALAQDKVYGTEDPALLYDVLGLVNNPGMGVADTAVSVLTGALARTAGESVADGPYLISLGNLAPNSNYTVTGFTGNLFTVLPAPLTVKADSQSKIFGTADSPLTFTTDGLIENPMLGIADTEDSVIVNTLSRVEGESVLASPYAITQGNLAANSNYLLTFTGSQFTIIDGATEPVIGFDVVQYVFAQVITHYRPGSFWHVSLNAGNADPGFDVMRGTSDRSESDESSCDSVLSGGFCETWSFPEQRGVR